jgi:protocatechuate 3,4-dioxygenase beta subunit
MKQRDLGLVVGLATLLVGLLAWLSLATSRESSAPAADVERPQVASPSVEPTRAATSVDAPTDSDPSAAPEREARGVAANAPQRGPTGSLVVRAVWSSSGKPAVNVGVRLQPESGPWQLVAAQAKTDAAGVARFAAIDAVRMRVLGDRDGEVRANVAPKTTTEVVLVLASGVTVSGRVADRSGRGVSNAQIWIGGDDRWVALAECDSSGRYRVEDVPAADLLIATARDWAPSDTFEIPKSPVDDARHDFTLGGPGTSVVGQVLEGDDRPVAGAFVVLEFKGIGGLSTTTDDEGRFAHHGAPPGAARLRVSSLNFAPALTNIDVALERRNEHIVRLEPGAELSGVVTLDGAPVEDASVVIPEHHPSNELWGAARTDAQGRYRISGLPPGLQHVRAMVRIESREGPGPWQRDAAVREQVELIAARTVIWNAELKRDE